MRIVANAADDLMNAPKAMARLVYSELQNAEISLTSPLLSYKSVASGLEQYRLGSERISLGPKQAFLAPADEKITVQIGRKAVGQCLYFKTHDLAAHLAGAQSASLESEPGPISDCFGLRLPLISNLPEVRNETLDASDLDSFLASLATQLARAQQTYHAIDLKRAANTRELTARLETARDHIMGHIDDTLSLDEIASAACLSRYHLSRQFSTVYGMPPLRFHQHQRLLGAKRQLESGDSATLVGRALGFSEVAAFSRAYKRIHGCPPSVHSSNIDQPHRALPRLT